VLIGSFFKPLILCTAWGEAKHVQNEHVDSEQGTPCLFVLFQQPLDESEIPKYQQNEGEQDQENAEKQGSDEDGKNENGQSKQRSKRQCEGGDQDGKRMVVVFSGQSSDNCALR
jgi:hypothetical protein